MSLQQTINALIRDVPDYPQPGILFKDITPLLHDATAFKAVISAIAEQAGPVDKVAGLEARGFLLAAPVALELGVGFVPVRKSGKLPSATYAETYDLEYGTATIEVHRDAFEPGDRVLIVDDVLATGGTAQAAVSLVRQAGAEVRGLSVLMELTFLNGRDRFTDLPIHSLVMV
ncbi:adenine phosphoribosyltransferase [Actinocorallia sp. B10E7]|uniref:adenine phosphoribosyltransferase n=1 Tax=Actinocorallia sp. B10E7 TaxID=3153558 RepID=UPI00325C733F